MKHVSFFQRLASMIYITSPYISVTTLAIGLLVLPVILSTGRPVVYSEDRSMFRSIMRLAFTGMTVGRLTEYILSLPYGYRLQRRNTDAGMALSSHLAAISLLYAIPNLFGDGFSGVKWRDDSSKGSERKERCANNRPALWPRLGSILWRKKGFAYLAYLTIYWYALIVGLLRVGRTPTSGSTHPDGILVRMAMAGLYPGIPTLQWTCSFLGPLIYAIWPPTVLPRRALMERDASGIWRPSHKSRQQQWSWRILITEIPLDINFMWIMYLVWKL